MIWSQSDRTDIEKVKTFIFYFPAHKLIDDRASERDKEKQKLTKYSSIGFSRALLYDFCISVCLSACAMCKALASNLPVIWNRSSTVNHFGEIKFSHHICSPTNRWASARLDREWSSRCRCGCHSVSSDAENLQLKRLIRYRFASSHFAIDRWSQSTSELSAVNFMWVWSPTARCRIQG